MLDLDYHDFERYDPVTFKVEQAYDTNEYTIEIWVYMGKFDKMNYYTFDKK